MTLYHSRVSYSFVLPYLKIILFASFGLNITTHFKLTVTDSELKTLCPPADKAWKTAWTQIRPDESLTLKKKNQQTTKT